VSAILTSASLHDSQAAIPLAQMTSERIVSLYDLMDAAYDAPQIKKFSEISLSCADHRSQSKTWREDTHGTCQEGPVCPKKLCGTGEFVFER